MPIAINTNNMPIAMNTGVRRPPSVTNAPPTAGGGGAPRSTTTSRRGGRTRSRSPPVMGSRHSVNSPSDQMQSPVGTNNGGIAIGGENPSSAAAAAAAAAKVYSDSARGSGGRNAWPDSGRGPGGVGGADDASFHAHPHSHPHAMHSQGYDNNKSYASNRNSHGHSLHHNNNNNNNWPGDANNNSYNNGNQSSSHRGRYDQGGNSYGNGGDGSYHHQQQGGHPSYNDRRYHRGDHHHGSRRGHNGHHPYDHQSRSSHQSRSNYQQPQQHPDYRYGQQQQQQHTRANKNTSSSRTEGGDMFLGGTTPLLNSKPQVTVGESPDSNNSNNLSDSRQPSRVGTPASVFRGRPESSSNNRSGDDDKKSDDGGILSLNTPTPSFDDKSPGGGNDSNNNNSNNSSPGAPPQLFEKSPEGVAKVGSIDMAPSFNLFNQSFDSFGDTQYFNVDSALGQMDSFGMTRSGSNAGNDLNNAIESVGGGGSAQPPQALHREASAGTFTQQLLNSGSGGLTIGYSPVNSFGGTSTTKRGNSGPMVLGGGPGPRAGSPTQVLGMYQSFSAGGGGGGSPTTKQQGPLDDSHMRMSVGSFGPTNERANSYGLSPNPNYGSYNYKLDRSSRCGNSGDGPPFYVFLRKYKGAFKHCTFLLPGLKLALLETPGGKDSDASNAVAVEADSKGPKWDTTKSMTTLPQFVGSGMYSEPTPHEIAVARRRVESSVCAFGGNLDRTRKAAGNSDNSASQTSSIFRGKEEEEPDATQSVTVTPSSSTVSPKSLPSQTPARLKYEEELPGRYYENESRLSWEFEETPPIEISGKDDADDQLSSSKKGSEDNDAVVKTDDDDMVCKLIGSSDGSELKQDGSGSPQPKMRYRCKLCGQPKQNHVCPYQQSLARSIGITVYPAVNAFTASEPGLIAPPLSEMNNFTDLQKDMLSPNETSPGRDRMRSMSSVSGYGASSSSQVCKVTPESLRSASRLHGSPSFTSSSGRTSNRRSSKGHRSGGSSSKKRKFSEAGSNSKGDLLFLEAMELKPEQFRIVPLSKKLKEPDAYTYATLPLPYAQRKRLSDNLFSLSNDVPKLTDECAKVLREAREKDMWDLAVAELMTQVIVISQCPDGDHRFEGLRRYLLTLGISC